MQGVHALVAGLPSPCLDERTLRPRQPQNESTQQLRTFHTGSYKAFRSPVPCRRAVVWVRLCGPAQPCEQSKCK